MNVKCDKHKAHRSVISLCIYNTYTCMQANDSSLDKPFDEKLLPHIVAIHKSTAYFGPSYS